MAPIIRMYTEGDRSALIALWDVCDLYRPENDPGRDIDRKLLNDPEHLIVAELEGEIAGSLMFGYDGHRGWLNYLAVRPAHQQTGIATALVRRAESDLAVLGCPKVNLQIRATNRRVVDFYRKLGYDVDEVISMGRRLVLDEGP